MKKTRKRRLRWQRLVLLVSCFLVLLFAGGQTIGWLAGAFSPRPMTNEGTQPEQTEPEVKEEAAEDSSSIRITATGDILLEEAILDWFGEGDWRGYTDQLDPWLKESDLTIANLEVPIGGEELGITGIDFSFNAPAITAQNVADTGIDFVSLANNHAMDRGTAGLLNTQANLDAAGIGYTGTHADPHDPAAYEIIEVNGIRIGILSWTYATNQSEEQDGQVNIFWNAWSEQAQTLVENTREAAQECDLLIVCMHWGVEFTYALSEDQLLLSQQIADAGADVIIGNHPHTIQPAAWLERADGRQTLCFYSLGNLASSAYTVSRADETFQNMYEVGALAQFTVTMDPSEEIQISDVELIPYVNQFEDEYQNFRLIPLKDYSEELAAAHDQRRFSDLFTLDWLKEQVQMVFEDSGIDVLLD